eukprot:jgi/Psemu1/311049/fgenesh1_kg.713_\
MHNGHEVFPPSPSSTIGSPRAALLRFLSFRANQSPCLVPLRFNSISPAHGCDYQTTIKAVTD